MSAKRDRPTATGMRPLVVAGVAVVAGFVALLVVIVGVLGVLGAGASAHEGSSVATRTVEVTFRPADEIVDDPIIDRLEPTTVLTIRATGFDRDASGRVRQCVHDARMVCDNGLPVRFDGDGAAVFQYLITDAIGAGPGNDAPCRLGAAVRCTIEIIVGGTTTVIDTVFVDEAPPAGRLDVDQPRGALVGAGVEVTLTDFPPATEIEVRVCAVPATRGPRCGAPGPELTLVTGRDGTATGTLTFHGGVVGEDRVACGRRTRCQVVVDGAGVGIRARPALLELPAAPGPSYDAGRLSIGLAAAAALGLAATWLVRSTDWRPRPEADSTPIDEAVFADLDLEADLSDAARDGRPVP